MAERACNAIATSAAPEDHIDAHEQPERPSCRAGKSREDYTGKDKIDDAAHKHPFPTPRQLTPMLQRVHDGRNAFDHKEDDQHQRKRHRPGDRLGEQMKPTAMAITADTNHPRNPGACPPRTS